MAESRTRNTARNIASGLVFRGVSIVFPFAIRTALLWTLGAEFTGLSSLFGSILQVLGISELGFNTAVVYSLYEPVANDDKDAICELVSMLKTIYRIVGMVIISLGLAMTPFLKYLIRGAYPESMNLQVLFILYLANSAAGYFLFAYKECLLIASQRQDVANNVRSAVAIVSYVTQLVIIVTMGSFYAYLVVSVVGTVLTNVMINLEVSKRYPWLEDLRERVEVPSEIRRQVGGLLVNRLCDTFRNSLDSIIISSTIGLVTTAIYGNYYYVYSALYGVMLVICNSMGASVGNSIVVKSAKENFENLLDFSFVFSFVMGWSAAVMTCLYQPFMTLWAGGDLLLPIRDVLLFVLYYYLINMNNIRNQYIAGTGMWWELKSSYVAEAVADVVLNVALGYLMGITGVLLATIVTIFLFNYLQRNRALFHGYFKGQSAALFYRQQFYYFIATVVSTAASYVICSHLPLVVSAAALLLRGTIAIAVSGAALLLFYRFGARWESGRALVRGVISTVQSDGQQDG